MLRLLFGKTNSKLLFINIYKYFLFYFIIDYISPIFSFLVTFFHNYIQVISVEYFDSDFKFFKLYLDLNLFLFLFALLLKNIIIIIFE